MSLALRPRALLLVAVAVAVAVGLGGALLPTATAQTPRVSTAITNEYPQFLRFRLTATAESAITDVTLRYRVVGASSLGRARPEETLAPAERQQVEVRVPTGALGYIPVGSEFIYSWELTLADGAVVESESETFLYLPPREDWRSLSNDFMRVYYHGDGEAIARRMLEAAERTYERMAALLQTQLEVVPVATVLFASEADLEEAQPNRSETYDSLTFLCGTQVAINVIHLIDRSCGTRDRTDTLRHEFAHILTKAAGESAFGKVPSWLDEGTAVYAQTEPGSGLTDTFEVAVVLDRLIPFRTMIAGNRDPSQVSLFYAQSYEMVRFLIEHGGEANFALLFATIKGGHRFDAAIEEVYGWTLDQFTNAFRTFHGLDPIEPPPEATPAREQPAATPEPTPVREQPAATPEATPAREQPTATPTPAPPEPRIATAGGDGGRDLSTIAIIVVVVAAVLALAAVFVFLLSLMLHNRRAATRSPAGEAAPAPVPDGADADAAPPVAPSPQPPAAPQPPEPEPEPEEPDEWGPR